MRASFRSTFIGFAALILLFAAAPSSASPSADPSANFIETVSAKAFSSLAENGITDDERVKRFRVLLNDAFDLKYIGRFVLGVHGRRATDEQKNKFQSLFEKFVIQAYANRFKDLTDKKLKVIRAEPLSDKDTLVISQIEITGQQPIPVNWKVRDRNGGHKIIDVTVEGISMSVTQRDEFAAVIRQSGGQVAGLIKALRRKTGE
jgi:phospholipid transport system substrate-binding protein